MRHLSAAGWLGAAVWLGVIAPATPAATVPSPRPIVVAELFTSEGCSSCPPADEVLRRLAAGELADTADVVAIGEHVDYWDPGDRSYSAVADVSISTEWNASNLRIVAFVQERDSRRIIGAGATTRGPGLPGGPS